MLSLVDRNYLELKELFRLAAKIFISFMYCVLASAIRSVGPLIVLSRALNGMWDHLNHIFLSSLGSTLASINSHD
jgi:ABC-type lipoprotein release transport system permease subunit